MKNSYFGLRYKSIRNTGMNAFIQNGKEETILMEMFLYSVVFLLWLLLYSYSPKNVDVENSVHYVSFNMSTKAKEKFFMRILSVT